MSEMIKIFFVVDKITCSNDYARHSKANIIIGIRHKNKSLIVYITLTVHSKLTQALVVLFKMQRWKHLLIFTSLFQFIHGQVDHPLDVLNSEFTIQRPKTATEGAEVTFYCRPRIGEDFTG